jgi:hypothetical protein
MHLVKGSAEFMPPENSTMLIHSADVNHARDIWDRQSVSSSLHMLNRVVVPWKIKKQVKPATLRSTGSEIFSLADRWIQENKPSIYEIVWLALVNTPLPIQLPYLKTSGALSNPSRLPGCMKTPVMVSHILSLGSMNNRQWASIIKLL